MISVSDLHKLTPEEYRMHDLEDFVFNRHVLLGQNAQQIHEALSSSFDYTYEEIQDMINQRGTK